MAHGAQLVFLRWLQGRPGQVEALLDRLAAEQAWAAGAWPALLPLAYAGQGRDADTRPLLDRAMAALGGRRPGVAGLVALVGACAQLGDGAAAGRLSALLAPWAGHHLAAGQIYLGAAGHHLGILAATAGRWEDSLGYLRAALAAHERLGARPWQALTAQAARRRPPRPGPARRPGPGRGHGRDRPRLGRPPRHGAAGMGPPGPRPPPLTGGAATPPPAGPRRPPPAAGRGRRRGRRPGAGARRQR